MKRNFTSYLIKLSYFVVFIILVTVPTQSQAQKKAVAYLNSPVVYINLMLPSADSLLLVDGTGAIYSNQYSASVDGYDAGKLSNFNENIFRVFVSSIVVCRCVKRRWCFDLLCSRSV